MAGRNVNSFPYEFPMLVLKVCSEKTTIRMPCSSHGEEINIAIRMRHYLKIIRDTPIDNMPAIHQQVKRAIEEQMISVMGGGRNTNREFAVVLMPVRLDNPLSRALGSWMPSAPQGAGVEDEVKPREFQLPEPPLSDQEIWNIATNPEIPGNRTAWRLMSPAQRAKAELWMLTGGPPKSPA